MPQSQMNPPKQNDSTVSPSIPYRPLPPICTVPVPPPLPTKAEVLGTADGELTSEQIANWRKMIAMQFGPVVAQFLPDEDIRWYAKEFQVAIRER